MEFVASYRVNEILSSIGTRNLDKELLKSHRNFTTTLKLCNEAVKGNKVSRYQGLISSLQTTFTKLDEDFAIYKDDIVKKVCKTETAFNAVNQEEGEEVIAFPNNDKWAEEQFNKYVEARDLLETALDTCAKELNLGQSQSVDAELAVDDVMSEFTSIEPAVAKITDEIDLSFVIGFKDIVGKLAVRIDTDLKIKVQTKLSISEESLDPQYSKIKIRLKFRKFVQEQEIGLIALQ